MAKELGRLLTAMITPFKADLSVDHAAAERLAAMLVADRSDGGVEEASGDMDQMGLVSAGKPPGFNIWSGDDSFTLPLMAVGGYGVICVVSHIAGGSMKRMIEAYLEADNETARRIHLGVLPVIRTLMTTAANPVPLK